MIWIGVVVGAVLVGAVVTVVAGRTGDLAPLPSSRRDVLVPADRTLSADDLQAVRFSWAWRGYARDEVDSLMARLEKEARARDESTPSSPVEPSVTPRDDADG
ncbi:DivIVA domain-containing protein [Mumia sp. zg.B53]|uniref:DivIVA domain-containing protein n=1 Tax=unclassified Mumia TaxID=2621872 RepID=UPI001C6E5CE9|nr:MULTISPECIES: DivIVA domain-containing protein [unclassified Mumia]MBW9206793.1 DivIVA domain-containing protein [Mumia sp. zg.B17]MBW9210919.1 DivIVA domain-containing protein [Mumia sp. zg.B21]MBW9215485.1 DivIVA domain-containing protein [Mumia sp. zg.B53]MDD9348825.1 DivIVA domain-containing protein [Mumia sp.]